MKDLQFGVGDNNDRPTINKPETILGITIAFLVSAIIKEVRYARKLMGMKGTGTHWNEFTVVCEG
jgi:hypothetical protein